MTKPQDPRNILGAVSVHADVVNTTRLIAEAMGGAKIGPADAYIRV